MKNFLVRAFLQWACLFLPARQRIHLGAVADLVQMAHAATRRSLSFGNHPGHTRNVSYEEMEELGLAKPLDEFYRLLETSPAGPQALLPPQGDHPLGPLLRATVARPLPWFLAPEVVLRGLCALWTVLALALHHAAVVGAPAALWLAAASAPLRLPAAAAALHPALAQLELHPPADLSRRALVVGGLLAAMWLADRAGRARARRAWVRAAGVVQPEALEAFYDGWQLPGSGGGSGGGEAPPAEADPPQPSDAFVASVAAVVRAYDGEGEAAAPVRGFQDAAERLRRVAVEVGVAVPPGALQAPGLAAVEAAAAVGRAVGASV